MAQYKFYNKNTGEILSEHAGHPHDKDPLTAARQRELILNQYEAEFNDVGMIVSEGDSAIFFPDVIEKRVEEIDSFDKDGNTIKIQVEKKFVKLDKL
jgi:hypothetical protein